MNPVLTYDSFWPDHDTAHQLIPEDIGTISDVIVQACRLFVLLYEE